MTPNVDIGLQRKTSLSNQYAMSTCCMAFAFSSRWTAAWPDSMESKNRSSNIYRSW
jgi:hypothetical protein